MRDNKGDKITRQLEECLKDTAESIGHSFGDYWPADANNENDPAENNVALHLAHSLLKRRFSVFAEADHPDHPKCEGIDLLAISPQANWFLAGELKRILHKEHLQPLLADLVRLDRFWLNRRLTAKSCGQRVAEVVEKCSTGIGLVGGLYWVWHDGRKSNDILPFWQNPQPSPQHADYEFFDAKLMQLGGTRATSLVVRSYPGFGGTYYLLSAYFKIRVPT